MIRSKRVGVFFVTQHPTDVPESVLAQLGNRIQHALRASTPNDADALRKTVRTYPTSELYDLEELLTSLGIGEAAVTVLDEKGVPTPVVHAASRAAVEHGAGARPRAGREGVAALGEVRHAPRARDCCRSARAARRVDPGGARADAGEGAQAFGAAEDAERPADRLPRPRATERQCSERSFCGVFGMLRKRL